MPGELLVGEAPIQANIGRRTTTVNVTNTSVWPVHIGSHTTVMPLTLIRPGTSIGTMCRVGGEVSNSIIHGYSNKQHDGFLGIYSHLGMVSPAFAEGRTAVAAGEKIGVAGNTGITSGWHLYFGMVMDGKPVDPAPFLGVPLCNGEADRTTTKKTDTHGAAVGGRRYYQIWLPARQ